MSYTKRDAHMTQGLAILCMVVLHLFCRVGDNVLGVPLLWLNETTPVVFLFGFLRKYAYHCIPSVLDMPKNCFWKTKEVVFAPDAGEFCD